MEHGDNLVTPDCRAVADILSRIGDKWTVFVVRSLAGGPRRFTEIKRLINGISQRMLTLTLRGLERDGFVTRTVTPTIPPRVDYELTGIGRTLIEPLNTIGEWATTHRQQVEDARAAYDEASSESAPPRLISAGGR
ncbi:MAG: helix-turn-helix transcriptional regulator [Hyphomicrobiales bacterium]|nr:helix-turn-helix transcriptional regulator [Hyphomicrobiales bacterium]